VALTLELLESGVELVLGPSGFLPASVQRSRSASMIGSSFMTTVIFGPRAVMTRWFQPSFFDASLVGARAS